MTFDDKGNPVFTPEEQTVVGKVVQNRVARVKAEVPADYAALKALNDELAELYPEMTAEQRAAVIKQQKAQSREAKEKAAASERARQNGTTVEQELEASKTERRLSSVEAELQAKKDEEKRVREEAAAAEENKKFFDREVADLQEACELSEEDMAALNKDEDWLEFVKGKTFGPNYHLKDAYKAFEKMSSKAGDKAFLKREANRERAGGAGGDGGKTSGYELTKAQEEMLDNYNRGKPDKFKLTRKEYAEQIKQAGG